MISCFVASFHQGEVASLSPIVLNFRAVLCSAVGKASIGGRCSISGSPLFSALPVTRLPTGPRKYQPSDCGICEFGRCGRRGFEAIGAERPSAVGQRPLAWAPWRPVAGQQKRPAGANLVTSENRWRSSAASPQSYAGSIFDLCHVCQARAPESCGPCRCPAARHARAGPTIDGSTHLSRPFSLRLSIFCSCLASPSASMPGLRP